MSDEELALKVSEVEHRAKSNTRRIEKLEQNTAALNKMATSIEILVVEQTHQTEAMREIKEDVAKLDGKVETLESKPGKRWDGIVDKIILTIIGLIIGYIFSQIGMS